MGVLSQHEREALEDVFLSIHPRSRQYTIKYSIKVAHKLLLIFIKAVRRYLFTKIIHKKDL